MLEIFWSNSGFPIGGGNTTFYLKFVFFALYFVFCFTRWFPIGGGSTPFSSGLTQLPWTSSPTCQVLKPAVSQCFCCSCNAITNSSCWSKKMPKILCLNHLWFVEAMDDRDSCEGNWSAWPSEKTSFNTLTLSLQYFNTFAWPSEKTSFKTFASHASYLSHCGDALF